MALLTRAHNKPLLPLPGSKVSAKVKRAKQVAPPKGYLYNIEFYVFKGSKKVF